MLITLNLKADKLQCGLGENLRIAQLCKDVGLAVDTIKQLFKGEAVTVSGELHSSEHNQTFSVQDAKLEVLRERSEPNEPDKYRLSLNGQNIIDWFKQKFQELTQSARPYIKSPAKPELNKGKGLKR